VAAKEASPDVYFVEAFSPTLDILGQQLQDSGVSNLASIVSFSLSERPELFEGGWYTDSFVSPEFKARLDQRYPASRHATQMMPYAYDSFKMLVEGFESGQDGLTYVRHMTEYSSTAGKITKEQTDIGESTIGSLTARGGGRTQSPTDNRYGEAPNPLSCYGVRL
jgi:hypothetical protein